MVETKRLKVIVNDEGNRPNPQIAQQIKESLLALFDLLLSIAMLFYYIGEGIYKKFVPDEIQPVKGEIVLITGTGHGIGRELALLYAQEDAIVVCVDVNEQNNKNTLDEIEGMGKKAYGFSCDIANRQNVEELAEKVKNKVGEITILINNAGIMRPNTFLDQPLTDIEATFNIDIMSHFWTLRAFLPTMLKNNKGHIVALASMAGLMGLPNLTAYCASKFAVVGLMESLHEELRFYNSKNRINTTTICPFIVDTGLCKKTRIKYESLMPYLSPKDVAQTIMKAQRTNQPQISIPEYLQGANIFGRMLPLKAGIFLKDRFEASVLPEC